MEIVAVEKNNLTVYLNLAQSYEGEFSGITKKRPDKDGIFKLDTKLEENIKGYLLYIENVPAGLAAIAEKTDSTYEVCEFYVVPCFRKQHYGLRFAHALWEMMPGDWEVKQIVGAEYATQFWRKTIGKFKDTTFAEDKYLDTYWGDVIRQSFTV